ncbi:MAG TPA: sulfatase [Membranihabitans sp.]|nr:sulfatase [Membranihabitans sp.]
MKLNSIYVALLPIVLGSVWMIHGIYHKYLTTESSQEDLPNIVYILSDDQAWTDYGFMGHPHIQTPNIDKLASEGLTFTRGYTTAPVCSPSLASIITGLYPHQHRITGNDPKFEYQGEESGNRKDWLEQRLSHNQKFIDHFYQNPTLPMLLKQKGYLSFQSGKWWEGSWKDAGFTSGMTYGDPSHGGRHGDEGLKIGREGMDPIFDFLDEAESSKSPFFLWYAPFLPHNPHNPPDSLLQKYIGKTPSESIAKYWAMCEWFDITVGQLLDEIKDRGMEDNTLVVLVCDNGWIQNPQGNGYEWPSKQSPYDLGIRTPIIYKWPGRIKPQMDTTHFVSSIDMVPTTLEAVGLEPNKDMRGINVLNTKKLERRKAVFSQDSHHDMIDVDHPEKSLEHRMILKSPWKLIVPVRSDQAGEMTSGGGGLFISVISQVELYNIVDDPLEKNEISSQHPSVVKELKKKLDVWWDPGLY